MAKRTGLGRGIGALIPTADQTERPVDVFFPGASIRPSEATTTTEIPAESADAGDLARAIGLAKPGDQATVVVWRERESKRFNVTLGTAPPAA